MNLLTIDTTTEYLSIALTRGDKIIARVHKKAPMMHSTLLVPTIAGLLKKAKLGPKDLDGFCISIGPGSFTGLRIGVTTIKGLAYAMNKPIVTVPTLDVIAANAKKFKGVICPVLDARKNKVYTCLYKSDGKNIKRISKYLLTTVQELTDMLDGYDDVLMLGDGMKFFPGKREAVAKWQPRADVAARAGIELFGRKKFVSADKLEPMYLYSKECDITGR